MMASSTSRFVAPLLLVLLAALSFCPAAVLAQFVPMSSSTLYSASVGAVPARITFTPASPPLSLSDDAVDVGVPLGFTFSFFDVLYTAINIGANGNVQFQTASSYVSPSNFGNNAAITPYLALFFSDLYPVAPGSRQYATIGTAPNRQFVLRYNGVPFCCDVSNPPAVTADVVLTETSNRIELRYYNVDGTADEYRYVTIGIEGYTLQGADDFIAVADGVLLDTFFAANLTGYSYSFSPIQPFTSTLGPAPPAPSTGTSTVYGATQGTAPAAVAFTPAGTLPYTNDDVTPVSLPFSFVFYNISYNTAYVGANGNVQFQTEGTSNSPTSFEFSGNTALTPFIAAFYADLLPNSAPASRTYATLGAAPNRQFIIRYSNVPYFFDPAIYASSANYPAHNSSLSCDVLLYETSNNIELRYYAVAQASSNFQVDIGIQAGQPSTDYISVIDDAAIASSSLVGTLYTFSPLTPFVGAQPLPTTPPLPSGTSAVYTAALISAPAPVSFTPAATLPLTDDDVSYIPLGFNFTFYNVSYQSAFVAANGNLQFATSSPSSYPYTLGTSSNSGLSPFIAYFWIDLLPKSAPSSRTYATIGTAPNRQFILRNSQVPLQTGTGNGVLTCDVLLTETTNVIELRYYSVPILSAANTYLDIGIQNSAVRSQYDYEAVVNHVALPAYRSATFSNYGYTFTPKVPFTKPTLFKLPGITPTTTSKFYSASATALPAALTFTPTGTLPYDNDGVAKVVLGFTFIFYNVSYSNLYIGANGNIQFATANTQAYPSAFGANNVDLTPLIAFFWVDLVPNAAPASRTYATLGSAPNRQFILRYSNVPLQNYISDETLSCDVLLYEGSNKIEFRYYSVPSESSTGYTVDVGIQNSAIGTTYDSVALINNKALLLNIVLPLSGSGWTFTPLRAFTNPTVFTGDSPPTPVTSGSTVYTASLGVPPTLPVAFNPAGSLPFEDDGVEAVFLGFNFTFYNVAYSTAYISSNGNLQFSSISTAYAPAAFGSGNAALAPFIAFFWTDLNAYGPPTSRTYATVGTAPNRQFILRYSQVPLQANAFDTNYDNQSLSCDVLLSETSNAIELRYYQAPAFTTSGVELDIGIQNSVSNSAYDFVSVINAQQLTPLLAPAFTGISYTFTPLVPFTNPRLFSLTPSPASSSTVYSATGAPGSPPLVAFTPAGTLPADDNGVVSVPLGFTFVYYGVAYSSVYVSSNGDLQFQTSFDDYTPTAFGAGLGVLAPFIAFFYTDLDPALGGSRTYATIGSAPNRQWILRYSGVPTQSYISSGLLSCDVVLTESSNAIEFRYYAVPLFRIGFRGSMYYVDIGIESGLNATGVNDWISVVNHQTVSTLLEQGLNQSTYVFTPIRPFINAQPFTPTPIAARSNSSVYSVTTSTAPAMISLGPTAVALPPSADSVTPIRLGFDFIFYGTSYSVVFPAANGNLQFQTGSQSSYPSTFEVTNTDLGPFVAAYLANLYPATNTSRSYAILGSAPNRQVVIRYLAVPFENYPTITAVTCDIILTETANSIELRYYSVSPSPFSTDIVSAGITDGTATEFIALLDAVPLSASAAQGLQGKSYLFSPFSRFPANPPVFVAPQFSIVDNSTSYSAQLLPTVVPPVSFTPTVSPPLIPSDDGVTLNIPLGFTFSFYGTRYQTVNVAANGNLQFVTSETSYSPDVFGTADALLAPFIAYFWSDLYPNTNSSRSYGTIGTAPNRQWILRLNNVPFCCGDIITDPLTADVVLSETTNTVEIRYYAVPSDGSHGVDIGLQNNGVADTDWVALYNAGTLDPLLAAQLPGSTLIFYPQSSCQPNCPFTPTATASLCLILYSLPGNIDYPFSIATSISLTYNPKPFTAAQGTAVVILSGSGTRTFTNKFGDAQTTPFTLTGAGVNGANNLLYLGSSYPVDSRGLTLSLNSAVQLPGAGPQSLSSLINVFNSSGVVFEYGVARIDGLGSAWLSTVPGFVNVTIGPANLNALAPNYATCQAPLTFTNGLRVPIEGNVGSSAVRFTYSYYISDGATYSVQGNLTFTATSQFPSTADLLGNNYQTIANITGTRTYTHFPSNQRLISQVTGLSSVIFPYADQRWYPYALLVSAPGVYTTDTAPFLDQDGVEFAISPPAPVTGAAPGTGVQYSAISLYNTAPEPNAVLVDGTYTNQPLIGLQHQTYTLLQA